MASKLIRKDLLKNIQSHNLTPTQAETALEAVLSELSAAFKAGTKVELRGFGTFTPKVRLGGKKRNPRTGEAVYTQDALVVRFKLSKEIQKL